MSGGGVTEGGRVERRRIREPPLPGRLTHCSREVLEAGRCGDLQARSGSSGPTAKVCDSPTGRWTKSPGPAVKVSPSQWRRTVPDST